MDVTNHARIRLKERYKGKIIGNIYLHSDIVFKKGLDIPKEVRYLYLKNDFNGNEGIYKLWKNYIFVYNKIGDTLITVIKFNL